MRPSAIACHLLTWLLPLAGAASVHVQGEGARDAALVSALEDFGRIHTRQATVPLRLEVAITDSAPPLLPPPGSPPGDFREGWSAEIVSAPNQMPLLRVSARDTESAAAAIYAFLRASTGVTWFGPGEGGEFVPPVDTWKLPTKADLASRSPFVNRHVSGLFTPAERLWARRMGIRQLMPSGHNFTRLFTPADLAENPSWLGKRGGRPVPAPAGGYAWQVELNDATAAHAAARIGVWSREQPDTRVFSLGVNDTTAFTDSVLARSRGWFRERPDLTDPVFEWTSKVAAQRPDLWHTALAYYYAENAPSAPVAPNVIPWLTADRTAWSDPAFRADETALIARWKQSGAEIIGIYDYLYGIYHLFPRSFEPTLADSLPTAHRLGVRAYTSELYPVWGFDGPKAYLLARLLDDPTLDPKSILESHFQHQFGPAAPAAKRFWKRAAEVWARAPGPVRWIKFYRDENQLACLTDSDLRALRRELDAMLSSGAENAHSENIHRLAEAWEVTELAARLHRLWLAAEKAPNEWKQARETLARRLADPAFRAGPNFRLADASYVLGTEPVEHDAFRWLPPAREGAEQPVNLREGAVADLARQRRTLEHPTLAAWRLFDSGGRPAPRASVERPDDATLALSGQETLRLNRTLLVSPGELLAVGCLAEGRVGPSSPVAMELTFFDSEGRRVAPKRRERIFGNGRDGRWPLLIAGRVPDNAEWASWSFVVEFQEKGDRLTLSRPFSASGTW